MTTPGIGRNFRMIRTASPAAGAQWSIAPGGQRWWRVVTMVARLVTSAVVGNRRVTLRASRGGHVYWAVEAHADQIASITADYAAHTGATSPVGTNLTLTLPLPSAGLLLHPGAALTSVVSGMDAGDQWSAIVTFAEEIPSGLSYEGDQFIQPAETLGE